MPRKIVVAGAAALFSIWLLANWEWLQSDEDSLIRFVLGLLLSLLILFRPKSGGPFEAAPPRVLWATSLIGASAAVGGIIFNVNQFEWLGIILVIYSCLRWALPPRFGGDIILALVLFYWIHPLPGQVFGALQIRMQYLSVWASEWGLHILNHEAWADGIVLRTGGFTFEVPESCSGMTTGVTVLLCSLGTAILMRFRWFEAVILVALGLIQVMALNIIRITHMVIAAVEMPRAWSENFLHDTLGTYLLISIVLVQVEASIWRAKRMRQVRKEEGIAAGEVEPDEKATVLPYFWRTLFRAGAILLPCAILAAAIVLAAYKRRDSHRAAMIARSVPGMIRSNTERGMAAAREVLELDPTKYGTRAELAKGLITEKRYAAAMTELALIPDLYGDPEYDLLEAWCLHRLDQYPKALARLDRLPAHLMKSPGVAMLRAEIAAMREDAALAAENILTASRVSFFMDRVRGMYPFLAAHEKWETISRSDHELPYTKVQEADLAVRAHLRVNKPERAATSLELAISKWPDEPRFLDGLVALTRSRPGGEWRTRFIEILDNNLAALSTQRLAAHLLDCFELERPDIGWKVYQRLRALAPAAPVLDFVIARYGDEWFRFRRVDIQTGGADLLASIDLKSIVKLTRGMPLSSALWGTIPELDRLLDEGTQTRRAVALGDCIAKLVERHDEGNLSGRQYRLFADAQALAGRYEEAHDILDEMALEFPDLEGEVAVRHSELYAADSAWQSTYEVLRASREGLEHPPMAVNLLFANATLRMGFGAFALKILDETSELYPDAPQIAALKVAFWDHFGEDEEALALLRGHESDYSPELRARLLYDTGRFRECEEVASTYRVGGLPAPTEKGQRLYAVPAEWAAARRWLGPLTEEQTAEAVAKLESIAETGISAFARGMAEREVAWLKNRGAGSFSEPAYWLRVARDDDERGCALYKLLTLLAQYQRYEEAEAIVVAAVEYWPRSRAIWRAWIALSEGRREVIDRALQACPEDPDAWLASMVTGVDEKRTESWMQARIDEGLAQGMSTHAIIRAGDFLLRKGLLKPAINAARAAEEADPTSLSSAMLSLRCAIADQDRNWAVSASKRGAENAFEPWPFYEAMVQIKSGAAIHDPEVVKALEYLRTKFTHNLRFSQMLGDIYFRQGDMARALSVLKPTLGQEAKSLSAYSFLVTAEAARRSGKPGEAVTVLRTARTVYPENREVLNNLVHLLATQPERVTEARALLENDLLNGDAMDFAMLDTAAFVYLRAGEVDRALGFSDEALAEAAEDHPTWPDMTLNAAEIRFRLGDLVAARARVEDVRGRKSTARDPIVSQRSLRILRQIEREEERQRREKKAAAASRK